MIEVIEITDVLRNKYNDDLIDFTKNFVYPFGPDSFTIDRGRDYFAFLGRVGMPLSLIAIAEGKIVASISGVARNIDIYGNGLSTEVWYICDLKVKQQFRGQFIIQKFLKFAMEKYQGKFKYAYGISMNSRDSVVNKIAKFAKAVSNLNFCEQDTLAFYLLSSDQIKLLEPIIQEYCSSYSFISMRGTKDLILSSTQRRLPLMHFSKQSQEGIINEFKKDNQYMLCFPLSHEITTKINLVGLCYFTTASIISNMKNIDWGFIETGDL